VALVTQAGTAATPSATRTPRPGPSPAEACTRPLTPMPARGIPSPRREYPWPSWRGSPRPVPRIGGSGSRRPPAPLRVPTRWPRWLPWHRRAAGRRRPPSGVLSGSRSSSSRQLGARRRWRGRGPSPPATLARTTATTKVPAQAHRPHPCRLRTEQDRLVQRVAHHRLLPRGCGSAPPG
jgi:hypothetical protein